VQVSALIMFNLSLRASAHASEAISRRLEKTIKCELLTFGRLLRRTARSSQ
jgi:hypothetical protein